MSAISDSTVQFAEYDAIKDDLYRQKLPFLNKEMAYYREEAVKEAKNYNYRDGEADFIVKRNFERALKDGKLSKIPNMLFWQQKKL